jgi:hypothetical protein
VENSSLGHYEKPASYSRWRLADPGATVEPAVTHVDITYCDAFDARVKKEQGEEAKRQKAKATTKRKALSYSESAGFTSIW